MNESALTIEHLVKSYGEIKAVNDISLNVDKGALFAFLGVNGAGKSTTINIICSILRKDAGKVFVNGYDLDTDTAAIKNEIGIVFQTSVLDKDLTVKENLEIRTSFYALSRQEKEKNLRSIIRLLELDPILKRPIKQLSGGQQRRVDIARAMIHNPKLLILDEPTTGLDPKTRLTVWALIDDIRVKTGMTVFLTTHYLEEADKASDVVIMDRGKVIAHGTPHELKSRYSNDCLIGYLPKNEVFETSLHVAGIQFFYDEEKSAYRISVPDTAYAKEILIKYSDFLSDIEIIKGNMDDVFLSVTGREMAHEPEGGESDKSGR